MLFRSMGQPGPSTLTKTCALISCLNLDPTIEMMKSVESLCNHHESVKKSTAYRDVLVGEKPSFPPLPLQSRIEEIPEPVAHMPPTGKQSKKSPIMTIGLPTGKKDKGKKKVISPPVVISSGDEALDWGSDDGCLYNALDDDIAESACYNFRQLRQLSTVVVSKVRNQLSLEECKSWTCIVLLGLRAKVQVRRLSIKD